MNQNSLFLVLAAPACAWVAGMGLFKTLLTMTAMHRWLSGGEFSGPLAQVLGNDAFLYVIGALAAVELIVDLIPRWDIAWQRWNGHLRIIGAMVLSWVILHNEEMLSKIIMSTVGAALAITSYTATTSARKAAIRGSTSSLVAPVSSVTENCMVIITLLALTRLPPMTLLMLGFMMGAALLVIYVIKREARETFSWIFKLHWIRPEATDTSGGRA